MQALIGLLLLAAAPGFAAQPERSLPFFFIPNQGLADSSFLFLVETPQLRAGFSRQTAIFQIGAVAIEIRFSGASQEAALEGTGLLTGQANFIAGDRPRDWKIGLPTYGAISYRNLYPGIDLVYAGAQRQIKSEYLVAPGANPARIRQEYGTSHISIGENGDLVVRREGVELIEAAPLAFQDNPDGTRTSIAARYRILDGATVGFEVEAYDVSRPLVIDPVVSYSTYLGGSGQGGVTGVAVDGSGNLYATGWTEALNFPIAGAVQAANQGGVDIFVAKLNPAGSALVYSTYIGGRGDDRAAAIAVNSAGQAYVTGVTASTNFPLVAAARPTFSGGRDAFALKLNTTGNALLFSTYLGGSNLDSGTGIAVDSSGNAYITGDTLSADFPKLGAAQNALGGGTDAFVTKLSSAGAIAYSTLLGGAGVDHAGGIAVDSSGNAYVAGGTASPNFPVVTPLQSASGGSQDAFVTKLNASGSSILYSTYLGGSGGAPGSPEQVNAIAVDGSGNAYVAGVTNSNNFPVTAGAFQTLFNGVEDAFVSKLNPAGTSLVYSTYLGGASFDWASGIAIDSSGNAYVAGYTSSAAFPVASAVQNAFNGLYDAFVSKLNSAGNTVGFSTLYGGSGADQANAIALDTNGNIFVGGQTASLDFRLQGAIQSNNVGGNIGWVARFGVTPPPAQLPAVVSVSPASGSGNTVTFTAQYSHPAGATALTTVGLLLNASASPDFGCYVGYNRSANQFLLYNDQSASGAGTVLPGGGSAQNSQCTLIGSGTSAAVSGATLTLTVALAFQPGFPGNKTVYLSAADVNVNTGWVAKGTWTVTVPPPQPSADSVSPSAAFGSNQTFTFVFSDTQNPLNLTAMAMLFNTSVSIVNACDVVYDRNQGTVALVWDTAAGSDSKPLSSATVLQNSQCQVGAATATISGLSVIVTLAITFKGSFSGVKNIYMFGSEGAINTGYVQRGTYTVAAGGFPVATSVVPASGSGPGQRFTFRVTDQGGSSFINSLAVLIAGSLNLNNACSLVYDRTAGTVSLAYDDPSHGAAPLVPGSATVVSNSQCLLRGANTTVTIGATFIDVTMDLSFFSTYSGAKTVYLLAAEIGVNSGYTVVGSWTVTGGAPTADSVTPDSGAGSSPTFTFTVSDSSASSNISGMSMLFTTGSPANTGNACYLVYDRINATIGLYSDNATVLSTKGIGSSNTLQNSQCAVGYTVMNSSLNSVLFTINPVFKPAFNGAKTVYLQANEPAANSGFVARGTWTVQ